MHYNENKKRLYKTAIEKMKTNTKPNGEEWWIFRGLHNDCFKFIWSSEKKMLYKYMSDYLFSLSISEMDEEELFTFKQIN